MRAPLLLVGIVLGNLPAPLPAQEEATPRRLFAQLAQCRQPQLAVAADGTLAVVFVAEAASIQVALRPPGGEWQAPVQVAKVPHLACGMHRGPRIAFAGRSVLVAYIEAAFDAKARRALGSGNLMLRRSVDGRDSSAPLVINSEPGSAREGLHALAAGGDRAVLVWLDARGASPGAKLFAARSADGGRSFGADFAAYASPDGSICPCCHPSAAIDQKGRAVVMWRNAIAGNRDAFVGTLGADGIADAAAAGRGHWQLAACPMDGGGLALLGDGRPLTVWRREGSVFGALGGDAERRLGDGRNPVVAATAAVAMVVWEQGNALLAQPLPLPLPATLPPAQRLGDGGSACIAALPEQRFVILAEGRDTDRNGLVCWQVDAP